MGNSPCEESGAEGERAAARGTGAPDGEREVRDAEVEGLRGACGVSNGR